MSLPLVTCVCPTTAARRAWLPRAFACFLAQTYANRELLIVPDEGERVAWETIPSGMAHTRLLPPAGIRVAHALPQLTLGAKRNFACGMARGEVIAHWDDDDYSAPGRLADQIARLQSSGKALTGYTQMKFTDGAQWWRYVSDRDWPLGTSLMFRKDYWARNRFPDEQVASDNGFIFRAQSQAQVATVPAGDMMAAAIHSGSTNRRNMQQSAWEPLPASEAIPAALAAWPEAVAC